MRIQGKKEIAEAVIIAFLSALATELLQFGISKIKDRKEKDEE